MTANLIQYIGNQQQVYQKLYYYGGIIIFDYNPHEFPDEKYKTEVWGFISDTEIQGIIPNRYQLSTYGRLLDNETGKFYPTGNANEEKYPNHVFKLVNGGSITVNIHQLVAEMFKPIRPINADAIDHIDSTKYHNWVWNLDYVTRVENLNRAGENNLFPAGENHHSTKLTENEVRTISKMISEGYTPDAIRKTIGPERLSKQTLSDIKAKRSWRKISDEYFEPFEIVHKYRPLSEDEENLIRRICSNIEKMGYESTGREIAIASGIPMDSLSKEEQNSYRNFVNRIRYKQNYTNISKDYNF